MIISFQSHRCFHQKTKKHQKNNSPFHTGLPTRFFRLVVNRKERRGLPLLLDVGTTWCHAGKVVGFDPRTHSAEVGWVGWVGWISPPLVG